MCKLYIVKIEVALFRALSDSEVRTASKMFYDGISVKYAIVYFRD
jgi:hypothetical protein